MDETAATRWATFDCYGTLVDWEGGAAGFLYQLALRHGDTDLVAGRVLRDRWEAIQFELVSGPYRPYKEILGESLRLFCEERGWPYDDADAEALVRSMRSWQPFPDTRPALTKTREAGIKLVIISNTDRDIIEHTLRHIDVPFDDVITAEDAGQYKPGDKPFELAIERIGLPPEQILHTAFGFKYDIGPGARHGMQTAWINRHVEPPPGDDPYDHDWRDLWGLAEFAERQVTGDR
jgi:2-haloalkanoic acid dehalogenase type II